MTETQQGGRNMNRHENNNKFVTYIIEITRDPSEEMEGVREVEVREDILRWEN